MDRRVCRVLATAAALAAALLAGFLAFAPATLAVPAATDAAAPAATASATAAATSSLTVSISAISPAVVTPSTRLTIKGAVRNDGSTATRAVVQVVHPAAELTQRSEISAWASGRDPVDGRAIASKTVSRSLAPGASAAFTLSVKGVDALHPPAYGFVPISVQTASGAVHTFAAYQRKKEYEPLALSFVVPITLDGDPALFGPGGTARDRAWTAAIGDGSRLDRLLTATDGAPVTWAIDPLLTRQPVVLGESGSATTTTTTTTTSTSSPTGPPPAPTVGGSTSDAEAQLRSELASRLTSLAPQHSPLVLPDSDADVAAAAQPGGGARGLVTQQVRQAADAAAALGGRADVAWPADGAYTAIRERVIRQMYAGGLAAEIVSQTALPPAAVTDAARRSANGVPLLAYDERLSGMFASTRSVPSAVLSAQQFIADSVLLLNELPGTRRSVLVAAPRSFAPDPAALRTFLSAVSAVPWLAQSGLDSLLDAAARATPISPTDTLVKRPPGTPRDPVASRSAVLTGARGRAVESTLSTVAGVARIRADGTDFARVWTEAGQQLTSARWRGRLQQWSQVDTRVDKEAQATARAVTVSPRNVNFLADKGRLQITVSNTLNVPVHDVTLRLIPDNPRLRVDQQPAVMHIGARSRTTVTARVTSLSAGLVPITTTLTGPDGTVLGRGAVLKVQLSPTGDWVYWALGAIAGTILVLGVVRSVRRRPRRAAVLAAVPAERKETSCP
jgi:hypothetical protein